MNGSFHRIHKMGELVNKETSIGIIGVLRGNDHIYYFSNILRTGTSYLPLDNPQVLQDSFDLFIEKLNLINDL